MPKKHLKFKEMETDLTSVIIGLTSLAIFMAPIFIYQVSLKKTEKKLLRALKKFAVSRNIFLDEKELFRSGYAIGIDATKKELVWIHDSPETPVREKGLSLEQYDTCTVYKSNIRAANSGLKLWETGLSLKSNKGSVPTENIPLFSADEARLAGDETIRADKWKKKIQQLIVS